MTQESPIFGTEEPSTKKINLTLIGTILGAAVLVALMIWFVVVIQKKGPAYKKGRTVYKNVLHKKDAGFDHYLPYLKIINATGQVSENLLGWQQAVVAGDIANSGNRIVDVVEIEAVLLSPDGKVIRKFIRTPIKPDFPLLPMEERQFSIWVEPFPKQWLTGRVEVKIHGYRIKK